MDSIRKNKKQKNQPIYLHEEENDYENLLKNNENFILFLDYDGTLVDFRNHPLKVHASSDLLNVLNKLISIKRFEVVIITGRPLNQIKNQLPLRGLHFAANHGLIIQLSNGTKQIVKEAKKIKPHLKKIKKEVDTLFSKNENITIEDKTYSLAFHYRTVPAEKVPFLKNKFIKIVSKNNYNNSIELIDGDKVIEARPAGWNKANAVEFFLNKFNQDNLFYPLYIGDDTTDEDAFQFFKDNALTIYVKNDSNLNSYASYWVKNPDEVFQFLKILEHSAPTKKQKLYINKQKKVNS